MQINQQVFVRKRRNNFDKNCDAMALQEHWNAIKFNDKINNKWMNIKNQQ